MEKTKKVFRGFFLTILFPLIIYLVMYIITHAQGVKIFGMNVNMWRAVLVNTAIATAEDPALMGRAFALAVQAGRMAHLAKLAEESAVARASSPLTGFLQ